MKCVNSFKTLFKLRHTAIFKPSDNGPERDIVQSTKKKNLKFHKIYSHAYRLKTKSQTVSTLRENALLILEPQNKANILNRQFQDAFTPITSEAVPDKGPSPRRSMPDNNIT
ncbi:hypothetical protein DPMN_041457 [Dreissena polymorpha]|uniref:Uncharacterized protein n=1 Tax=Dreissena polymorpha TaxID=45954 RepID=A0A9D4CYU1_DREPO|nr:hypothetical protein DPMN_041390 [Dreissena polymorpha]KAH3734997.1 hypothetical protein DPMN_041457 [Dreissena polymorpha]